jgi:ATP-binding cassette, subfamily F, member 3
VENLSFGYTLIKFYFVISHLSLLKEKLLAIIGKNGKGKSTLLNTIAGELKPLSGEIKTIQL